ncbi:hypothetical protein H2198_009343 [Neophaeococcomyces mojaviensis]|uniref:Uncharacterized protein n=1 Tax=Neophaeococcomyces mojaviensis TaxID=3383035 RepID=A0ACC2ZUW4_9EURO|nr:hypothetical protein H2198_009343 [Knufia sp. JES_112]
MPRLPTTFLPFTRSILRQPIFGGQRRAFHPEPRSFTASPHSTHRALYRWTAQAIGTPFLVAYICEKISERGSSGETSWKLQLPQIEAGLLVDPSKLKGHVWGTIREFVELVETGWKDGEEWVKELLY